MPTRWRWVLPCPRGCEEVLADEVRALGVDVIDVGPTVVQAVGALSVGYRLCLWSRVASRVLLPLIEIDAADDRALYRAISAVPWWEHFDSAHTFAIGVSQAPKSPFASHFWVQRAKDAIVDAFRARTGTRPSVDKKNASIRLHLHIGETKHELALDFSGDALHRRGYRRSGGRAPVKENLAAAILHLAGWPRAVASGTPLLDPMCGSGTFLIEGALIATNTAPGLLRDRFGFEHWAYHDATSFEAECAEARAAARTECTATIYGFDASETALADARVNLRAAGMDEHVSLARRELSAAEPHSRPGILVCNPPYGHRLGEEGTLFLLYQTLGDTLKRAFGGWTAYVFAAQGSNLKHLGLRPARRHVLYNGAIECRLLEIPVREPTPDASLAGPSWRKPSDKAEMFANRIKKNQKKWGRWAQRNRVDCYRIYDADIPEFDVAVDRYAGKAVIHVFQKQRHADDPQALQRVQDVILTLPDALRIDSKDVIVKVRRKHDQGDQYARLADRGAEITIHEGELRFIVSLEDRIDTGLFLDHRQVRAYAAAHCQGKRMLNLFAYTCSVSVAAAFGGAAQTVSVDLSNTYLDWGKRNFRLNDLDPSRHRFFRRDATQWIAKNHAKFGWIFINPPTFSRSKMSKGAFNVHKDHAMLVEHAMRSLDRDGELLFTTHARQFELDSRLRRRFRVDEATGELVPPDFIRHPFRAFRLRH